MKNFFESAKKQIFLGVDQVKQIAGLKHAPEDPNFLNHWEQLQDLELASINLYKSLSDLINSTQKLCDTSVTTASTLSSGFDVDDTPYYQKSQQSTAFYTDCRDYVKDKLWNDINEKCLMPLSDYMQKITDLKKIAEKRKKNRILIEAAVQLKEEDEVTRRQEKLSRLTQTYIDGVEALSAQKTPLFVSVFNEHQFCMRSFIEHAKSGSGIFANDV
ncbi:hypothetical protein TRFO_35240 [Tritrichomonas foetus]|uniref:BAR domain-containing protein n=1 Tax=Tritrichomonas foetus TaxID=1144522 RepID=A0A1J4JJ76_9EUKA|nr:hypothetical protein TRFO_35240 [Tritrichomonas foetus]|eukprot:OHS98391.1 hypothetical protein TRFO_35240 [Tritrichomonas foetus]